MVLSWFTDFIEDDGQSDTFRPGPDMRTTSPFWVEISYSYTCLKAVTDEKCSERTRGDFTCTTKKNWLGFVPYAFSTPFPVSGTQDRKRQTPPREDLMVAEFRIPSSHEMSISNPPRAIRPLTEPLFHACGSAGNR